ncbi:MAG: UvrD-helicase domain-containing protein, partial [Bacteroidales bacterium]|nr:UvrD-helicase domain-containing protein [Bacteroidales bacterium]
MSVADQHIRDEALDIQRSFAVSAPAGSGKTGLLIRRTLRLLAECDHPEQVLAITFTRKAAAEMQERILAALVEGQCPTPPGDTYKRALWEDARQVLARDSDKDWQLIANPGRLRIMTIDSLCRHLARQLAVETGLGDLPEPADQPEPHYREAIRSLFAQLDQPGPVGDSLALLLAHLDNNPGTLENLLQDLLARREQWLKPLLSSRDAREALEGALANTVAECLGALRTRLQPMASDIALLCDYAAANLDHLHIASPLTRCLGMTDLPDTEPSAANLDAWLDVAELLLTKAGGWRAQVDKRSGFPTAKDALHPARADSAKQQLAAVIGWCRTQPGLLELLGDLRHLPAPVYSDNQWQLLEALALLLPRLVAELSLVFQANRACDFTEITLAAQRAMRDEDEPS